MHPWATAGSADAVRRRLKDDSLAVRTQRGESQETQFDLRETLQQALAPVGEERS